MMLSCSQDNIIQSKIYISNLWVGENDKFFFFLSARCRALHVMLGCHAFFPEVLCSYCFICLMQYMFQPAQFSILIYCEGLQLMPELLS